MQAVIPPKRVDGDSSLGELLRAWNDRVLAMADEPLAAAVLSAGSVLRPPADEGAIRAAEERLRVALPPSYRAFLARTDGAYADDFAASAQEARSQTPVPFCCLLPAAGLVGVAEVLPEIVAGKAPLDEGVEPDSRDDRLDGEPVWGPLGPGLADAVLVSSLTWESGKYFLCLTPVVAEQDAGGEGWECWDYSHEEVTRFLSFGRWLRRAASLPWWLRPDASPDQHSSLLVLERVLDDGTPAELKLREIRELAGASGIGKVHSVLSTLAESSHPFVRLAAAQASLAHSATHGRALLADLVAGDEPTVSLAAAATLRLSG